MNAYFDELRQVARKVYGDGAVSEAEDYEYITVTIDGEKLMFLGDDESNVLMRVSFGNLQGVQRRAELLEDFLCGGCFWQGTDGAVISLSGEENEEEAWLTERMPVKVLMEEEEFENRCEDLLSTAHLWSERLRLYRGNGEEK